MDVTLPLAEMSVEEKLRTLEALCADLSRNAGDVPVADWHGEFLDERQRQTDGDYGKGYGQFIKMLGEEGAGQLVSRLRSVCPDFEREVLSVVGGRIWTRGGIDLKTRSLCSICVLAALGRNNALKLNLQMALRNGARVEEICEAMFQVAAYAGFPAAWDALDKLAEVLKERDTPSRLAAPMKNYVLAQLDEIPPQPCPCGATRRGFALPDNATATIHRVDISVDARVHYHKRLTEIYLILEGEGHVELDGERVPVRPMTAIMIKPGCRHRAIGHLRIVNVCIPPFDPGDEWFD